MLAIICRATVAAVLIGMANVPPLDVLGGAAMGLAVDGLVDRMLRCQGNRVTGPSTVDG